MITIAGRFRRTFTLFAAALLLAACDGEDGPTGPQGPPGTANVIYSEWFTAAQWDTATIFGIRNFSYTRAAPQITQAILDSGVVLTYGRLTGYAPQVWPADRVALLPVTLTYVQGNTQVDTWSAYMTPGNLRINFTNNMNFYTSVATTHRFRYVIIPGGAAAAGSAARGNPDRLVNTGATVGGTGYTRAELQAMPYEQVRRLFNIPQD